MNRSDYKDSLGRIDRDMRVCIKYLEGLMEERFKLAMQVKKPQAPKAKVDLSRLESKDDSLQKQINGLRSKVDASSNHIRDHEDDKKFLRALAKRADEVLDEIKGLFDDLYDSGYFKEGTRRKIRDEGLIKRREEE